MRQLLIVLMSFIIFWPAYFTFGLTLFRQKIKVQLRNIMLASFLMSQVTLIVQTLPIQHFIAVIQPIFCCLCLILFFRIKIIHALTMTLVTYIFGSLIETGINGLLSGFRLERLVQLFHDTIFFPAITMSIIYYIVSFILYKSRWGFSFIQNFHARKELNNYLSSGNLLLIASLAAVGSCGICIYKWNHFVFVNLLAVIFLFSFLIKYLFTKELAD